MSFILTGNFLANARGVTFTDGGGVTWTFNPNTNSITATTTGGGGVTSTDSIQGTGTSGSPLELVGDSALPGNSFYYGTNASGTKGWFTLPSGGVTTVALVDGSTAPIFNTSSSGTSAVTLTETLKTQSANTFFRGPPSGSAAQPTFGPIVAADLPAAAVPGSTPDLMLWFDASRIVGSSGTNLPKIGDSTPWLGGVLGGNTLSGTTIMTIDSTKLNGLNLVKFPGGTSYILDNAFPVINAATIFVVIRPATLSSQAIIGSNTSNALSFHLYYSTPAIAISKSGVGLIGASTTTWTAGTAFQGNVTYTASSGAFAFRVGRTATNSGTGTTAAGTGTYTHIGSDGGTGAETLNLSSLGELIVYNRVLTNTEITNIENYLFAKWGV